MFEMLMTDFAQTYAPAYANVHGAGLDMELGPFDLHIRQSDGLLTAFIGLEDIAPRALSEFSDWPTLHLSSIDETTDAVLWAREWVDRLDGTALASLVERLVTQAGALKGVQGFSENTSTHQLPMAGRP